MCLSSVSVTTSGRESCGSDENATATSARPSSSALTPASATVGGVNADRASSPYTDLNPTPQAEFTKQSDGAARLTVSPCASAEEGQRTSARATARTRIQTTLTVDSINIHPRRSRKTSRRTAVLRRTQILAMALGWTVALATPATAKDALQDEQW